MRRVLVRAERCWKDEMHAVLAVEFQPTWWERFCGAQAHVREYRGFGTVWYELPKMVRQPTYLESWLADRNEWWEFHHDRKPWRYGE